MHGEDEDAFGAPHDDDLSGDDGPIRGWVPPDDRLWRHPSERFGAVLPGTPAAPSPVGTTPGTPRGVWIIGGLTFCVLVALVVSSMVVASSNDSGTDTGHGIAITGVPTTEVDVSHLTDVRQMTSVASGARSSTVALVVTTRTGTRIGTGVVAEAGGIVVGLRPTVSDARSITVVEADGSRQDAVEVGSDAATGIVVLRIADDLPVADFTTGDPSTGSLAMAMSAEARGTGDAPAIHLYAGTVLYAGIAGVGAGDTGTEFCATAIAAPLGDDDLGSPLVEPSGAVAGVLAAVTGTGGARTSIFLPAELVRDVTSQIVSHGSVQHGVLGAVVVDAAETTVGVQAGSGDPGALVQSVSVDSPAQQAGIDPGDRIVAIDGGGVRSVAELTTRLYAEPPGTELPVTLVRSGATLTDTVVLGPG